MEKKGGNGGGSKLIRRGETAAGATRDVIEQAKSGTRRKQGNEDSSSGTTQTGPEGRAEARKSARRKGNKGLEGRTEGEIKVQTRGRRREDI